MSLVACRECGFQVSESATKCPRCGVATPSAQRLADNRKALGGCLAVALITPVLLMGYCTSYVTNATSGSSAPASTTQTSSNIQNFEQVAAVLEAQPGVRVERDPAASRTMRIHIDRLDVTRDQAQQLATMARSRLGGDAIVRVYDRSGRLLARATSAGVE